ncbi:hypothetical protein EOL96_04845 [Candidatus Saccharibacteria bacterium]|nr:hypothetical protein [Candidatus Saccharibacteria bacterium]
MPKTPKTLVTSDGRVVTVDMSLAVSLVCKGFKINDCQPLDEVDLPGAYIYVFSESKKINRIIAEFHAGKLLVEPSEYWRTIDTLHEKYHERTES